MPRGVVLRPGVAGMAIGVLVWLVAGAGLFGVLFALDGHQRRLFEGLHDSRMTAGVLVAKDTQNHDGFTYSYVDQAGRHHLGGDSGEGQEQGDPARLHVGAQLTIWYSASHPAVSCYCTPSENPPRGLLVPELTISQFLAVPLGVLSGVVAFRRRAGLQPFRFGRGSRGDTRWPSADPD